MKRELIGNKLIEVLKNNYNRDLVNCQNKFNKHLLGNAIRLTPRDLVYFVEDIEKQYHIKVSTNQIMKYKLFTLNHFIDLIVEEAGENYAN